MKKDRKGLLIDLMHYVENIHVMKKLNYKKDMKAFLKYAQ